MQYSGIFLHLVCVFPVNITIQNCFTHLQALVEMLWKDNSFAQNAMERDAIVTIFYMCIRRVMMNCMAFTDEIPFLFFLPRSSFFFAKSSVGRFRRRNMMHFHTMRLERLSVRD